MKCIPQPDPDVLTTPLPDGDMILLHLRTSRYFSLNKTGALIWSLMKRSTKPADMSRALFDQFEITPKAAHETVGELMRDLQSHQLIK